MSTAVLAGSTGLVGSNILSTLTASPSIHKIHAYTRKDLSISEKLSPLSSPDPSTWPSLYPQTANIFFSALGTSRAQAGSLANQKKIDYDLNMELAKAAKERGTEIYVLISTSGANASSPLGYPQMKGSLEESVKTLGFRHLIILRPGLIVGQRQDSRPAEFALRKLAGFMGTTLGDRGKDFWAQDAVVIARAAVNAGVKCLEGAEGWREGVRVLGQADVVRLGRTEWKG